MGQKRHWAEEIVNKLRQAEFELGKGKSLDEARRRLSISEPMDYAWQSQSSPRECSFGHFGDPRRAR